jgi:hypothetical protein
MARPKKGNEDQLLLLLACGMTQEVAARNAAVSERTVRRRLRDPDFCRRLQQLRAEMLQRTGAMLTAAGGESVRTLVALQKESIPAAVRLGAARATLEISLKIREVAELEQRLAALEAAQQQGSQGPAANGRVW